MLPLHILIADDDPDESYLFKEALEHSNIDAVLSYANDGNSLISFLKSNPLPHLVIVDINMPYKDGLEAITEIRSDTQFSGLPLIIYSNSKNAAVIENCYQKGADMFIVKPSNFDGMVKVVKKLCYFDWKNNQKPSRSEFVITED